MLSSRPYGTLYTGVTRDLGRRMIEHKAAATPGFTARYGVHRLVWMEDYERIVDATGREKALKKWRRDWKIALIETMNPTWDDLFPTLNSRASLIPDEAQRRSGTGELRPESSSHTGSGFGFAAPE